MGTPLGHNNQILVAVDIDDDEIVDTMKHIIGAAEPAKKGKKGLTIFCRADPTVIVNNRKFKRKVEGKAFKVPSVEILARRTQTVIPPSIHPDGPEYEWHGRPLLEWDWSDLPLLMEGTLYEIQALCNEDYDHYQALNEMVFFGVDKGGNTHDACVSAVWKMVEDGWPEEEIFVRIDRAKRDASHRGGLKYDWPEHDKQAKIKEWIASAKEKGAGQKKSSAKKIPPERKMANWILEQLGGEEYVVCAQGQLRQYHEGYWPKVDIPWLLRQMYAADPALREREAKTAVSIVHTLVDKPNFGRTPGLEPRNDPKRQKVCLMNGTLNMRTGQLEKWDPDNEIRHRLDFEWDDEALCPTYDRVVKETFDNDDKAIALWDEFCALTLVDDMSFQKLLFLKGPGGNGKGTVSRILRDMHDPDAVGSVAVTDLNDERKRTSLVGKLVNISGEQSRLNLVSDTYLKKITGGDPIDVRKLYGETQNNVVLPTRFLELVNEMPATSDNSHALRRRIIILETPRKVNNPDPDLDRKLASEHPGILRRWVSALARLYERGYFDEPDRSKEEVEQYLTQNDPLAIWVNECCESIDIDAGEKGTPSNELYTSYREWCEANNVKAYSSPHWGQKMNARGYPAKNTWMAGHVVRTRPLKIKEGREF
jgi:P4 family phage/plasmid primase-like protien